MNRPKNSARAPAQHVEFYATSFEEFWWTNSLEPLFKKGKNDLKEKRSYKNRLGTLDNKTKYSSRVRLGLNDKMGQVQLNKGRDSNLISSLWFLTRRS